MVKFEHSVEQFLFNDNGIKGFHTLHLNIVASSYNDQQKKIYQPV